MSSLYNDLFLKIADIRVRLRMPVGVIIQPVTDVYTAFRDMERGLPEVDITVHVETPPKSKGRLLFNSGSIWRLYEVEGKRRIETLISQGGREVVERVGIFSPDFTRGKLYVAPDVVRGIPEAAAKPGIAFPFSYPLDELLFIHLLSQGRGVELHGCGVQMDGVGLLFVGESGAGKSTVARLMAMCRGTQVLSDDRIILRESEGRCWIHGTPWHGDARAGAPGRVELKKVFIIRHGDKNAAQPLVRAQGAAALLARSFLTYWDAEGMKYTLDLIERVSNRIPIYDLAFIPTLECVEYVKHLP